MLVDTHCHLTYEELAPQIDAVLARAAEVGVERMVTVATDLADAAAATALLAGHPALSLAAGIHPHQAAKAGPTELAALEALHQGAQAGPLHGRLVAVGETGLDFHYDFASPAQQEEVFRRQLALAVAVRRPVIIHARKSVERVLEVLSDYDALRDHVVFHCFSEGPEIARRVLDAGYWLSFTGVLTFKNSDALRASAQLAPHDRIMVETDAPFLTPEPVRKVRPCEPAFVAHTARRLAEIRGVSADELAHQTTENAQRFFGLS